MTARNPRTQWLVAAVLVLTGAACGNPSQATTRIQKPDVSVAPTPTPIVVFEHPLTGEAFNGPSDWQNRKALAVKIGNSPEARPQAGLQAADIVYEELAEGGITRFIAVFSSRGANSVGPVRSARLVDPQVLEPIAPLFAYAGGVPPVIKSVRESNLTDVSFDKATDAYRRIPERKAPHNVYTTTARLWSKYKGQTPPVPLFSFLPTGAPPTGGAAATTVDFAFSPAQRVSYQYQSSSSKYLRFQGGPHTLNDGSQVSPSNVLFQFVAISQGSVVDVNGQRTPDSTVSGSGEAILLRGGQVVRGRWTRSGSQPTQFVDQSGAPMLLARGQTWVELVPAGTRVALS